MVKNKISRRDFLIEVPAVTSLAAAALTLQTPYVVSAQKIDPNVYSGKLTPSAVAELEKLANNPELAFFKKTRAEMLKDLQYPKYHFLGPDGAEYTSIRFIRDGEPYNRQGGQRWTLSIDTSHGWQKAGIRHKLPSRTEFLQFNNEPFNLRIFLDVSIVEVFVSDKAHQAERTYPQLPQSTGVSIRSTGNGKLQKLQAWPMATIYS